jgi:HAD superfamily hydrolase (TIGR01509 family)
VSVLEAVIFDFDGVVLDSETPEFESHRRIFERWGAPLTSDEWCDQIGVYRKDHERHWFLQLCERSGQAVDPDAYGAEKRKLFLDLVPPEPMRGIRALLEALRAAAVPTAIASSSPARWVVPAAERIGLSSLIHTIVAGDDVANRKPAPDVYLEALRRLGAEASRSVAIEDSGPGVAAARAAGMKAIAIPHWLTERHDLDGADLRVAHAGELSVARLATLVTVSKPSL